MGADKAEKSKKRRRLSSFRGRRRGKKEGNPANAIRCVRGETACVRGFRELTIGVTGRSENAHRERERVESRLGKNWSPRKRCFREKKTVIIHTNRLGK